MPYQLIIFGSMACGPAAVSSGHFGYIDFPSKKSIFQDHIFEAMRADEQLLESMHQWPNECSEAIQEARAGVLLWKIEITNQLSESLHFRCDQLLQITEKLENLNPTLSLFACDFSPHDMTYHKLCSVDAISISIQPKNSRQPSLDLINNKWK